MVSLTTMPTGELSQLFPSYMSSLQINDPRSVVLPREEKRTRSVSFDDKEHVVEIESLSAFSPAELEKTWYTRDDYEFIKTSARLLVLESRKVGFHVMLEGTAHDMTHAATDEENLKTRQNLKRWCRHVHLGRGLERWINLKHGKMRKLGKSQYINTVLQTQAKLQAEQVFDHVDELAETLGQVAISCSANAREYALFMGQADYYANEREYPRELTIPRLRMTTTTTTHAWQDNFKQVGRGQQARETMLTKSLTILQKGSPKLWSSRMA